MWTSFLMSHFCVLVRFRSSVNTTLSWEVLREINVEKHRQLLLCENNLLEVIDHGPDVQPGVADVVLGAGDLAREAALGVLLNINLNQNPYFDEMINIA